MSDDTVFVDDTGLADRYFESIQSTELEPEKSLMLGREGCLWMSAITKTIAKWLEASGASGRSPRGFRSGRAGGTVAWREGYKY